MNRLIDPYDCALFDLDGVVYLGPEPVVGAPEGIGKLRELDKKIGFVTNNSGRLPETVRDQLNGMGVYCELEDVATSGQASQDMLRKDLKPGAKVLVCGAEAFDDKVREAGFEVVKTYADSPEAVICGYNPKMPWELIDEAALAVQNGVPWYASNPDATRPTDRGIVPGAGGVLMLIELCAPGHKPVIAGKPYRPLLDYTIERMGVSVPIFVGDRLDTDIEGAYNVGIDSFMVFTGAHGKRDLIYAAEHQRPTYIGADIRSMSEPARTATVDGHVATCNGTTVRIENGRLVADAMPADYEGQLDALWAGSQLSWANDVDAEDFLVALDDVH